MKMSSDVWNVRLAEFRFLVHEDNGWEERRLKRMVLIESCIVLRTESFIFTQEGRDRCGEEHNANGRTGKHLVKGIVK